jgi:hypothetical protein
MGEHNHQPQDPAGPRDAIRRILLNEWDPIGIRDTAECQDEYDRYIGGIYRLLARGATDLEIVDHLYQIESQQMLWPRPDKETLHPVAQSLRGLNLELRDAG